MNLKITKLQGLTCLLLYSALSDLSLHSFGTPPPANIPMEEIMLLNVPKLRELQIHNDIFESVRPFPWLQCFPNIVVLRIHDCKLTRNDFISELIVLESLEHLELRDLPNLEDNAFTIKCENRFTTDNQGQNSGLVLTLAPVIACFKQLKHIQIINCYKLTNECLINGISKSKTLNKNEIEGCPKISHER